MGARIRVSEERAFLAWSCWLDYRDFLPQKMMDHPESTLEELLACETTGSSRAAQTRALLGRLEELGHLGSHLPLLVGGDWNSPSHLDYAEDTRDLHRGLAIPVPTRSCLIAPRSLSVHGRPARLVPGSLFRGDNGRP